MVVEVRVARTGPAILRALQDAAPNEAQAFVAEYRAALGRAATSLDLTESEQVLDRWWGIAYLRLNPPTEEERAVVRRVDAGEDVGWASPQEWLSVNGR